MQIPVSKKTPNIKEPSASSRGLFYVIKLIEENTIKDIQ